MSTNRFASVAIALIAIVSAAPVSLNAQNNQTGNIHGVVTDQSAALIPGVTVTLTSPALIVPQVAATDEAGGYHFEQLPVGIYKLTFDLPGFRQYIRENIQITAGFSAELKVQLGVGTVDETVTVSDASPVVDTTSTTVSTSVGAVALADQLPATRTMQEMISIVPGVMPTAAPDLGGGTIASFVLSAYGITGQSTALIEGINTRKSPSMYTSVHYVIGSASRTTMTAEIQVRTLMEEVWGEVDHSMNYPHPSDSLACREQLKVLARVTSSASRLVDSIFVTLDDHRRTVTRPTSWAARVGD